MARKRKVSVDIAPAVEQVFVNEVEEVSSKTVEKSYKCLECGHVNGERKFKRCGGSILREV